MKVLLDTHFVLWIVTGADRLREFPRLDALQPWGLSPVSLLELQYLSEVGRIEARQPEFTEALLADERFVVDEVPLLTLIRHAQGLAWTRDPFDRLLVAHSLARRVPLATMDRQLRAHHPLVLPAEG